MSRHILILIFIISLIVPNGYAQNLLSVEWQKNVCTNHYISHVYSICNDNDGNTYTLGSFSNEANSLGENISDSIGAYFLTKQKPNGEKIFTKNFGGTDNFTFGDIKICNNGDLILGLSFKSTFFINGDSLTNSLNWSSIIIKLDQNFNLKWFKKFPANYTTYINRIVLDSEENIYASIIFLDSILINGNTYSQNTGYGTAIAKLSWTGDVLWSNHYYSENTLTNENLKIKKACNSCPETLLTSGIIGGNSVYVNGVLKAHHKSKFNSQLFVATIDEHGSVLQTKLIDDGIRSIADFDFYDGRIFFAGAYVDTVNWEGTYLTPNDYRSIYIGELNDQADLVGFADLKSSKSFYLTGFKITPQFGFLISGTFDGSFTLQSSSLILSDEYKRGSFIASINESLELNDCKYIKGGYYNLRTLSIFKNKIIGSAIFGQTCNFLNENTFGSNNDISTFLTSDINQLLVFNPSTFPIPEIPVPPIPFSVQIYPNPFNTNFRMKFSESINTASLILTNSIGQVCRDINISQINDTEIIIDASNLQTGSYIVKFLIDNKYEYVYKLIKINH